MSDQDEAKLTAIRAVFQALFDAVAVAGDFDEEKWEDLIAAFNAAGRLVFGWPHLESRDEDLLGAIDALTDDFQATKAAIEQTTKEARIVMHDLHEVVGPPDEPEEPPPAPHVQKVTAEAPIERETGEEPPSVAHPTPDDGKVRSLTNGSPRQGPRYDRDAMFKAIRETDTLVAAAERLGLLRTTLLSRLDTLEGHGELPDDIMAKRPRVHAVDESVPFEERRIESAREASERTWRERHPEEAHA